MISTKSANMQLGLNVVSLLLLKFVVISTWSPHTLFNSTLRKSKYTTYEHRLLVNRPVQIPCFKPTNTSNNAENVKIYWSHRGFNLTLYDSPFISAYWDREGTLIINSVMARQINLWCHVESDAGSHLYVHRLDFVEAAYMQTVFAVDMNATLVTNSTKAFHEFLFSQQSNCIVRLQGGGISVLKDTPGIDLDKAVFQKIIVLETAQKICDERIDCIGVTLDYFHCLVEMDQKTAIYSVDFSIIHTVDFGIFVTSDDFTLDQQIKQTISQISRALIRTKARITSSGFGRVARTDVKLDITVQNRTVKMCLGVAGRLKTEETAECELCPAGSIADIQITLPPPPEQALTKRSDDDEIDEDHLSKLVWPQANKKASCRPCPACSYTETLGRSACLPCPGWHSTPIYGTIKGEGGEWIDVVCPRQGRWQVILNDYVTQTYGYHPVGKWFEELPELTRVWIYVAVALGSVFIVVAALIVVYCCIDVAGMLSSAADELRPLYNEAAIVVKTTRQAERERTERAAMELRELMKQDPNFHLNN